MGRATSGVTGMRFRPGDELLSMDVITPESYLVTVTDGGTAKRSDMHRLNPDGNLDYRRTHRGGLGVRAVRLPDERGLLVGAMMAERNDEVLVVMEGGKVVRSLVGEIPVHNRDATGVILAKPDAGDRILAVARNVERNLGGDAATVEAEDEPVEDAESEGGLEVEAEFMGLEAESTDETAGPPAPTEGDR
jgi:DNA gyrase subunit A